MGKAGVRVWGDGRTVSIDFSQEGRLVRTGYLSKAEMQAILAQLNIFGFFGPGETQVINPAGTGFHLEVNLRSKSYGGSDEIESRSFQMVQEAIQSSPHLFPYTPKSGYLSAVSDSIVFKSSDTPSWPDRFGFSLADIVKQGKWITAEPAAFVWDVINKNSFNPVIVDHGNAYLVDLRVDISTYNQDLNCWNP